MNRIELLQKVPLFAGLADVQLAQLPTSMVKLRAKEELFRRGEPAGRAYVVAAGKIKIVRDFVERQIVFDVVGPGAVIGELALLDEEGAERTRSASAIASSPADLLAIDRRDLVAFLRRHPGVALALCASLAARVRRLDAQLLGATFLGLETQLARTLISLAARFGKPAGTAVEIEVTLNQTELGQMIGFSRESVNKQLRAFARAGIAEMARKKITIRDLPRLRALAQR
jgi:CRP-like cAMP-binding protein